MNPLFILALIALLGTYILAYEINSRITHATNYCGPSISGQLQSFRSQIELYKIQHDNTPPPCSSLWIKLHNASNTAGDTNPIANTTYPLGPYSQAVPLNLVNNQSAIGTTPSPTIGWIYTVNGHDCTLQAVNTTGNAVLTY